MPYEDLKRCFEIKYINLCIWKVHLQFENANILIAKITFVWLNDVGKFVYISEKLNFKFLFWNFKMYVFLSDNIFWDYLFNVSKYINIKIGFTYFCNI